MRESAATKAHRLLVEHRVDVAWRDHWRLIVRVRGDSGIEHTVRWSGGTGWNCDCPVMQSARCSHVLAAQAVCCVNRPLVGERHASDDTRPCRGASA